MVAVVKQSSPKSGPCTLAAKSRVSRTVSSVEQTTRVFDPQGRAELTRQPASTCLPGFSASQGAACEANVMACEDSILAAM